MPLVVQKYGGSSVADIERIRRVARRVVATRAAGNRVVVVVSAMGHTTDALTKLAHEIAPSPQRRELDMLLTAGEREAMALVSLAILTEGLEAVSFTGSQVGIITDRFHSDARIEEIRGDRLRRALRDVDPEAIDRAPPALDVDLLPALLGEVERELVHVEESHASGSDRLP